MKRELIKLNLSRLVLMLFSLVFIFPIVIIFSNSFMSESEIQVLHATRLSVFDILDGITRRFITVRIIPNEASLSQFQSVLVDQPIFIRQLFNSVRITIPVVIGNLLISLFAAFGFTCWKWKYKEILFYMYIIIMLMPLQALLVPNFIIAHRMNIMQSHLAIIIPGIFAPFGTFLLRQFMKSIPDACYEAATIDGAGSFRVFLYIVVPQMKAGIAALAMLVFIEYWNVVDQVIVFLRDVSLEPLSVFLSRMADGAMGLIFAASLTYMIIPLLWLLFGQESLEKGIEMSGIK